MIITACHTKLQPKNSKGASDIDKVTCIGIIMWLPLLTVVFVIIYLTLTPADKSNNFPHLGLDSFYKGGVKADSLKSLTF